MSAPDPLPVPVWETTEGGTAHYLLGWLSSIIKRGPITAADWNDAIHAAEEYDRGEVARREARAETAKQNAIAARRRRA